MTRNEARMIAEELHKLMTEESEPFISREEAAKFLSCSVSYMNKRKDIPAYYLNEKKCLYRKSQLAEWVKKQSNA